LFGSRKSPTVHAHITTDGLISLSRLFKYERSCGHNLIKFLVRAMRVSFPSEHCLVIALIIITGYVPSDRWTLGVRISHKY
jgi:hypothetical protein